MANEHVCPLHRAGLLDNWLRRIVHNPNKFLKGLINPGQFVLDLGCGPGTFTVDMAKMTGETGKVFAVDLQEGMLQLVEKKAKKHKVWKQIVLHQCSSKSFGLTESVDFALAFYMLHESGEPPKSLLQQVWDVLKPDGTFLLVEPRMHIKKEVYLQAIEYAKGIGFYIDSERKILGSWAVLLKK